MMDINPFAFFIGWWLESTHEEDEQPVKPKPKQKKPRTKDQVLNIQLFIAAAAIVLFLALITFYEDGLR